MKMVVLLALLLAGCAGEEPDLFTNNQRPHWLAPAQERYPALRGPDGRSLIAPGGRAATESGAYLG